MMQIVQYPFLSGKLFFLARQCFISSVGIAEPGLKIFIESLCPECKVSLLLEADSLSHRDRIQSVLSVQNRDITVRIHQIRNGHPKMCLLILQDGRTVAFISGKKFTYAGFEKYEEWFYRVDNEDDLSKAWEWLNQLSDNSVELTLRILQESTAGLASGQDGNIDVDHYYDHSMAYSGAEVIDFAGQYFESHDYKIFLAGRNIRHTLTEGGERKSVYQKLNDIDCALTDRFRSLGLFPVALDDASTIVGMIVHPTKGITGMNIRYTRHQGSDVTPHHFAGLQLMIRDADFCVWLVARNAGVVKTSEFFFKTIGDETFIHQLYNCLITLGQAYWIELCGQTRSMTAFDSTRDLKHFLQAYHDANKSLMVGRDFRPGAPGLAKDKILQTIGDEVEKLMPLYQLMN